MAAAVCLTGVARSVEIITLNCNFYFCSFDLYLFIYLLKTIKQSSRVEPICMHARWLMASRSVKQWKGIHLQTDFAVWLLSLTHHVVHQCKGLCVLIPNSPCSTCH